MTRVYELRNEIHAFLIQKRSDLADLFTDDWLLKLSYLADIFSLPNELNLKLQGRQDNVFLNWKNVQAFQKSLKLWLVRLRGPNPRHYMFPTVLQPVEECDVAMLLKHPTALIQTHLAALIENSDRYFPTEKHDILNDKRWIQNPFEFESTESLLELTLSPAEKLNCCNSAAIALCKDAMNLRMTLSSFWISISSEYPVLSRASISMLIPFTTYKCELGFSVLTKMKTKHRNRLNAAPDMHVALSSCTTDWDALQKCRQAHLSH